MYISETLRSRGTLFRGGGAIPAIPIPLKDRKPIHISDVGQYTTCRRKWDWSSPLRRHLQPGILPPPLQLGQAVHLAMKMGYQDSLGRECMKFDVGEGLWHFHDVMEKRRKLIETHLGPLWEDEQETFDEMVDLGQVMITHYDLWAKKYDPHWRILEAEYNFRVPFPHTDKICYEGWFDGIIEDKAGHMWILEYKTSARLGNMPWVFRGMQATMYTWAASLTFNRPCKGVIYRVLRKKVPSIPKLTQQGKFSRNKNQSMTMEWAKYCIRKWANKKFCEWLDNHKDATEEQINQAGQRIDQAYETAAEDLYEMVQLKDEEFFLHKAIPRGKIVIDQGIKAMETIGLEMINPNVELCYVTGYHCQYCSFRDPCDLMLNGMPEAAQAVLAVEYAPRSYWEELDEVEDSVAGLLPEGE